MVVDGVGKVHKPLCAGVGVMVLLTPIYARLFGVHELLLMGRASGCWYTVGAIYLTAYSVLSQPARVYTYSNFFKSFFRLRYAF
jgi:hypothetical protein